MRPVMRGHTRESIGTRRTLMQTTSTVGSSDIADVAKIDLIGPQ